MNKIKTIFAGTPEFATHYLNALLDDGRFEIVGVITQSDKPAGRNQEIIQSPIKKIASENNIRVFQPEKLKDDADIVDELKSLGADLMVVVAYGQIIPKNILDIFKLGAINVHPSLLPKYRGASPVQSVILSGEKKTGVTIMLMDEKMDHGPILTQIEVDLTSEETNDALHTKLAEASARLLVNTIAKYIDGEIRPVEQDHSLATFCKTITRDNARIDWTKSAQEIKNMIYAFHPWPGTWTTMDEKRLKIFPPVDIIKTSACVRADNGKLGEIFSTDDFLAICCGENSLIIKELQLEGKKQMSSEEFVRGYKDLDGKMLI